MLQKAKSPEELGQLLCDAMDFIDEDKDACYMCPMRDRCDIDHNGWIVWMKENAE